MNVLDKRARRHRGDDRGDAEMDDQALVEEVLRESSDGESSEVDVILNKFRIEQDEIRRLKQVDEYLLEVHGQVPNKKEDEVCRLIYENANSLNSRITGNDKLDKARQMIHELEPDIVAFNEHRLNLRHKDNKNGFKQMFNGGELDLRALAAHNIHENIGRTQEGGTALLAYGKLLEYYDAEGSGKDDTGLGRWTYMRFDGKDGVATVVVCGYNPCYNNKKESNTFYQQNRRYFINNQRDTCCPRVKFRTDLEKTLTRWRNEGARLIVCLDANEDIYKKGIGKMLTESNGLDMVEAVGDFTSRPLGATFFRGSKPIDAVWATKDVAVVGACMMPVGYGIGDHRLFVVDFMLSTMVGDAPTRVVRPKARRLNTNVEGCAERYNKVLEESIRKHRLMEKMKKAHETKSKRKAAKLLNKLDMQSKELMAQAEKKCRRLKSGLIPFSPEAVVWIKRCQVYRSILRWHSGKVRNRGNLKRAARRCGILNPLQIPVTGIIARLEVCKEKCNYFRRHGHKYRRKHLYNRLDVARDKQDETAEKQILAIIQREKERSFWRRLNFALRKQSKGRAVGPVQSEDERGRVIDHTSQAAAEEAIWNEVHRKRYHLAEQAPICQGNLRGEFGYCPPPRIAESILDGSYEFDDDIDPATRELLEEIALIRQKIPKNSASWLINRKKWQQVWKKKNEATSSSESGLHFGHYKAGAESDLISQFHAMKLSLALRRGVGLDRWSRGLSVMLEKKFGVRLVSKLRAILLMEADFNAGNKVVYGERMLDNARKYKLMPEEIFSEKNRMADDGALAKTLFYDVVRQLRVPAAIASVDASNCYDRVAHAMASLIFQSFGVADTAVTSMLETIQEMKFFLRTAFGDSQNFAGSTIHIKTQGLCQGNGASPAGWCVISITILRAHGKKGHGAKFMAPISHIRSRLSAILFVDDTDLIHINMEREEQLVETHEAIQSSVENWSRLLIATGGTLKPAKCFYHLISFDWKPDGSWKYADNSSCVDEDDEDYGSEEYQEWPLFVTLPDGSEEAIAHLEPNKSSITLGVYTCPSGVCDGKRKDSLAYIKEKVKDFVGSVKTGSLRRRQLWTSVDCKLWPSINYGLCASLAELATLSEVLIKEYGKLCPAGGICSKANREIRQLDSGFYGAGFPHLGVEAAVAQINKLLMHYGCQSAVGILYNLSYELMILEVGLSFQPLQLPYKSYSTLLTHCWFKTLWEKCDAYKIKVETHNVPLKFFRERDDWLMQAFIEAGYSGNDLIQLGKVRVYQQAIFISDVFGADGRLIDERYLEARPQEELWSTLRFPKENPSKRAFRLWARALKEVKAFRAGRLGKVINDGHKIWHWRLDPESNRLLHQAGETVEVYINLRANVYIKSADAPQAQFDGKPCSVQTMSPSRVRLRGSLDSAPRDDPPEDFLEVLQSWGHTWLWKRIKLTGNTDWIAEAIRHNTLVAVTDGSYIKEIHPNLCSAAFFLECSAGRGKLLGAFPEKSLCANAFRGELLGLMAIHLILKAVNQIDQQLEGSAKIVSDCLGALGRVSKLPPHRIPSRCKHSDILKNILVNCNDLSFERVYEHVDAHQDDDKEWDQLTREAQLNCACDSGAKRVIHGCAADELPRQRPFPLESICVFVEGEKMTSDTGSHIRFAAQLQLAKQFYNRHGVLTTRQFNQVDWLSVYTTLHGLPRLFRVWACKQVMNIAPTNQNLARRDGRCATCPSCGMHAETTEHVLTCPEEGRVKAFLAAVDTLEEWLESVDTDPVLQYCIVEYLRGRRAVSMMDIARETYAPRLARLGQSQDEIGWTRFLEGMVSKELLRLQTSYIAKRRRPVLTAHRWIVGLITRLLEIAHGQWIYRNFVVHDSIAGTLATQAKEVLQAELETQLELGADGLLEEDKYLLEVNLGNLEESNGDTQAYWLLAIRTAREAASIRRSTAPSAAHEPP